MRGFTSNRSLRTLKTGKFVKKELIENPEFFKAFPHLQRILEPDAEEKKPVEMVERVMQQGDN